MLKRSFKATVIRILNAQMFTELRRAINEFHYTLLKMCLITIILRSFLAQTTRNKTEEPNLLD